MRNYNPKKLPLEVLLSYKTKVLENKVIHLLADVEILMRQSSDIDFYFPLFVKEESFYSMKNLKKKLSKVKFYTVSSKFYEGVVDSNYIGLINYEKTLVKVLKQKKISQESILKLHEGIYKKNTQTNQKNFFYREKQNWIGEEGCSIDEAYYLPPKPEKVQELMDNLIEFVNGYHPSALVQLSIAFAQFLIIHPFMDGNGRVARALVPLFMKEKKIARFPICFISEYVKKMKLEYFKELYLITRTKDWESWIQFFLRCLLASTKRLKERLYKLIELSSVFDHYGFTQEQKKCIFKEAILTDKELMNLIGKKKFLKMKEDDLLIFNQDLSLVSIRGLIPKIKHL